MDTRSRLSAEDIYPSRRASKPEVLKREDPVFYSTGSSHPLITPEQAASYERDGFLVLHDMFDADDISLLQREMAWLLANPETLGSSTVITEPGSGEVRSIFAIHDQSALMHRLAVDERLAGIASYLLGDSVYVHQSRLNYKPGFSGKEFYWHSDFETWHAEDGMPRMRALSISLLLAENTPHNGPLMLIPGSHKEFIGCVGETPDDHYLYSLKKQEYGVPDQDNLARLVEKHGIVAPTGKPGSMLLFDCNLMHGSNGNITPLPRSNAFFVYNAMSNRLERPFGASKARPEILGSRSAERIQPVSGRLGQLFADD